MKIPKVSFFLNECNFYKKLTKNGQQNLPNFLKKIQNLLLKIINNNNKNTNPKNKIQLHQSHKKNFTNLVPSVK